MRAIRLTAVISASKDNPNWQEDIASALRDLATTMQDKNIKKTPKGRIMTTKLSGGGLEYNFTILLEEN